MRIRLDETSATKVLACETCKYNGGIFLRDNTEYVLCLKLGVEIPVQRTCWGWVRRE